MMTPDSPSRKFPPDSPASLIEKVLKEKILSLGPQGGMAENSLRLPFSSSQYPGRNAGQPGWATSSNAPARPSYTFEASARSLALGPPRISRSRQLERQCSQQPTKSSEAPGVFPFAQKSVRVPPCSSPPLWNRSPPPRGSFSVENIISCSLEQPASSPSRQPRVVARQASPSASQSFGPVGSARIEPSASQVRRAVTGAPEGSRSSGGQRGQLYPGSNWPGVPRFTSAGGLWEAVPGAREPMQATSSYDGRSEECAEGMMRSPERRQSAQPSGSYVAPPPMQTTCRAPSYEPPPRAPRAVEGSYSLMPGRDILAPSLPASLSLPGGQGLRCTSPGPSFVAPPGPPTRSLVAPPGPPLRSSSAVRSFTPGLSFVAAPPPLGSSSANASFAYGQSFVAAAPPVVSSSASRSFAYGQSFVAAAPPRGSLRSSSPSEPLIAEPSPARFAPGNFRCNSPEVRLRHADQSRRSFIPVLAGASVHSFSGQLRPPMAQAFARSCLLEGMASASSVHEQFGPARASGARRA